MKTTAQLTDLCSISCQCQWHATGGSDFGECRGSTWVSGDELIATTADGASIKAQALASAHEQIAQGWEPGFVYDLGAYPGDVEALAARLGREPSKDERLDLERLIRAHLAA